MAERSARPVTNLRRAGRWSSSPTQHLAVEALKPVRTARGSGAPPRGGAERAHGRPVAATGSRPEAADERGGLEPPHADTGPEGAVQRALERRKPRRGSTTAPVARACASTLEWSSPRERTLERSNASKRAARPSGRRPRRSSWASVRSTCGPGGRRKPHPSSQSAVRPRVDGRDGQDEARGGNRSRSDDRRAGDRSTPNPQGSKGRGDAARLLGRRNL